MSRKGASVSLPPDVVRLVERESKRKRQSRSKVVCEAIVSHLAGKKKGAIGAAGPERRAIAEGLDDLRRGRVTPAFKSVEGFEAYRKTSAYKKLLGSA